MLETVSEAFSSTVSLVRDGVSYLADVLRRIASNLAEIAAPIAMTFGLASAGCESDSAGASAVQASAMTVEKTESTVRTAATPDAAFDAAMEKEPTPIGKFTITFYYMIGEDEVASRAAAKAAKLAEARPANDNEDAEGEDAEGEGVGSDSVGELASIVVPEMVTIYEGRTCKPITQVTKEFGAQLTLQGTGQLRDGRVVNVSGRCDCERSPCFKVTSNKWGTAGNGRPLQPFRTVAVDPRVVKLGSLLYVPLLDGRTMPGRAPWGGYVHDGCVVADDTGGGIDGNQLDLFVGRKGYYLGISGSGGAHSWARNVPVYDGSKRCERNGRQVSRRSGAI
jgi:3D (Asp-Asp-Asp) domain-containing protein